MLNRSARCSWLKPTALRRAAKRWRFAGIRRPPIAACDIFAAILRNSCSVNHRPKSIVF